MKLYQTMKKSLFLDIAKVDRVALTTDLWKSSNQTPFMVVSAHFISNYWTLNKRLILFKPLPTPHTGIAISDQLISTIFEWKLNDKVDFITVDNVSSNDVAISRVLSILMDCSKLPPSLNGKFFHVRCAAHIINLIVKDGLRSLPDAIKNIRESVCYVKSTPSARRPSRMQSSWPISNGKLSLLSMSQPSGTQPV
jgi:hypothetical protein